VVQQVIPQHLCNVHHWASSTRCSHHGIKFGDVIERDEERWMPEKFLKASWMIFFAQVV